MDGLRLEMVKNVLRFVFAVRMRSGARLVERLQAVEETQSQCNF